MEQYDDVSTYADLVHIVHIYVIEPHPAFPETSPYTGRSWPMEYSTRSQPRTYIHRVAAARAVSSTIIGNQLMLVDDMAPLGRSDPLWCSYGPAPNSGYLIDRSGTVVYAEMWVNVSTARRKIDEIFDR